MSTTTTCKDGHRCENGSVCTEKPDDEGGYFCDCDERDNTNLVLAGLYCQHEATSYCTFQQEISLTSFCTNNGACKIAVGPDQTHLGCICEPGYEGDHCQFVEGTQPDNWPSSTKSSSSSSSNDTRQNDDKGLHAGITALICLVVVAFIGTVAFVIYRKKKAHATPLTFVRNIENGSELEADGSTLKESMRSSMAVQTSSHTINNNNSNSNNNNNNGDDYGSGAMTIADGGPDGTTASATDTEDDNMDAMEDIQLSGEGPSEAIII